MPYHITCAGVEGHGFGVGSGIVEKMGAGAPGICVNDPHPVTSRTTSNLIFISFYP